jgi:hypothetical protein
MAMPLVSMTTWSGRPRRGGARACRRARRRAAADAAACELHERFASSGEERLVDAQLAELVRDERDAFPLGLRVREQAPHERGLSAAEEAADDQRRHGA